MCSAFILVFVDFIRFSLQICQIWPNINEFSNFLQEVELFHSSLPPATPNNSDKNNATLSLRKQKTNPYQLTRQLFLIILRRIVLFCNSNIINASLLVNLPSFPFIFHLLITTAYIKPHRIHELLFRYCFEAVIALVHNQKEIAIHLVYNSEDLSAAVSKEKKSDHQSITNKKNEEGLMEWLFHFLENHSNYSLKLLELALQLLDNLLNVKENKIYFEEYLCYHGILLTILSTYEEKSLMIVEFSFSCFLHLIESDDYQEINENDLLNGQISTSTSFLLTGKKEKDKNNSYHIHILSFSENMKLLFQIINKYYEKYISITELSLQIIYCLACTAASKDKKLHDFLFFEKVPKIVANIAKCHGPYHSMIAELSIHTIAILTFSTSFSTISSSALGGIGGIVLLINTLEKQELNNSLTAFYALISLRKILQAEEKELLTKNSTLYYAIDYSLSIIKYVISIIRQHLDERSLIAIVGLEILSLLATNNDIEIWMIISENGGIDIFVFILNTLVIKEDEKSRKTIQKTLEILLSFINLEESFYKRFEKLLSVSLLMNLLKYHGKYSLSLLSFVIHSFIILYPTKLSSEAVNTKCDEETIEIVLSLFHYYNERFTRVLDAQALFAHEEEEEEKEVMVGEERERKGNQEMKKVSSSSRIAHRSVSSTSFTKSPFSQSLLSSSSLLPAAVSPSVASRQLSLNQHDDYLCSLLCLDALIFLTSIPINQIYFINSLHFHLEVIDQMKRRKSFHKSLTIPLYPKIIDSSSVSQSKTSSSSFRCQSDFSLYFIKSFIILKQFIKIQNFQKRFIKEGIVKTIIEFLEFECFENIELCYVLLDMIILLAVHYKLILGELGICEWIIKLLVFYNNIYEEEENDDDNSTGRVMINNQIVELSSHCIINMCIHSIENKKRFLSLQVLQYRDYGIRFEDFDIILYLQLLLRNHYITNNTRLDIKEAINVLKFDC
jgi:hypothetical protein